MSRFGFSRFKTSRGRLLAILLAVLAPIAGLMAIAAWANYKYIAASIDRDYALLTTNYEGRVRVWIRGVERSLVASVSGVATLAGTRDECQQAVRRIVGGTLGFKALRVTFPNGLSCFYSAQDTLGDASVGALARQASETGIPYTPTAGPRIADTRLFFSEQPDMRDVVFVARQPAGDGFEGWEAALVVDSEFLANVIALGEPYPGSLVALILPNRHAVVSRGAGAEGKTWQPKGDLPMDARRWPAQGDDGIGRIYAYRPVLERNLSILAAFDAAETSNAWRNFLIMLGLPILVLASLTIVFLRASDLYIIRWLRRIEATARARSRLKDARVEMSPSMPSEIQSFSQAFNDMADVEQTRREALEHTLAENRFLVRELHHRVKNSLQVIQSYLALERRTRSGAARLAVADAEIRVQILSIAYRLALADGVIRPVSVADFLDQVIPLISNTVFQPGQVALVVPGSSPAALDLEKLVALGFLIADALMRAAEAEEQFLLNLELAAEEDVQVLRIVADRPITLGPAPRLNRGLTTQLGATSIADEAAMVIAGWRWKA